MILIIDNYDSFTYNLVQYFGELGANLKVFRNDELSVEQIIRMHPEKIVISPGPGRPEGAGISVDVINHLADKIPTLGVCLGHQAIGQAFGGNIISAPILMHGKVSNIHYEKSPIFSGLTNPFTATRYHSLVIEKGSVSAELKIIARTQDGVIMGIHHERFPLYGVQFHPESILTIEGKVLLKNFLTICESNSGRGHDSGSD